MMAMAIGSVPLAPSQAAPAADEHRCRRCGVGLVRVGSFYWHVAPQSRCPVTSWPANSIDRGERAAVEALPGRPAAVALAEATTIMDPLEPREGATTMSKRGGNKAKKPSKPPMANKGPKAK
ncbi:MAG: hypothetical protein ACRDI2_11875 [Chloroflexota bacterium]